MGRPEEWQYWNNEYDNLKVDLLSKCDVLYHAYLQKYDDLTPEGAFSNFKPLIEHCASFRNLGEWSVDGAVHTCKFKKALIDEFGRRRFAECKEGREIKVFLDRVPDIQAIHIRRREKNLTSEYHRFRSYNDPKFLEAANIESVFQLVATNEILWKIYNREPEFDLLKIGKDQNATQNKHELNMRADPNEGDLYELQGNRLPEHNVLGENSKAQSEINASNLTREQLALFFIYLIADGIEDAWPDRGKEKRLEQLLSKYCPGNQRSIKKISKTIFQKENVNYFNLKDINEVVLFLEKASANDKKYLTTYNNLKEQYQIKLSQEW